MELHQTLVMEIEKFEVWEQSGSFYEALSASPSLDDNARDLLHIVWASAIDCPSWRMSNDLEDGRSFADARLPWLSELARWQLVNAVSYQWR
ncbi:hypothetical protein [Pseudomonas abietaniphila]|uniref:hypothetical protein n=1 Tax=Pseudomonas abietaniphila TaxID=89065 RepID=UPI00078656BE|nr:hypothetical protein [Pseudomonas abietaniphila]